MSGRSVLLSDQSSGRTASRAITLMEYYQPSEVAKLTDIWCVADRQLGGRKRTHGFPAHHEEIRRSNLPGWGREPERSFVSTYAQWQLIQPRLRLRPNVIPRK